MNAYTEYDTEIAFWAGFDAAIDELDAQRDADLAAEAEAEAIRDADLDALIADLDAQPEPYADEWEAPKSASLWTATTGPDALWNSRVITEWEV